MYLSIKGFEVKEGLKHRTLRKDTKSRSRRMTEKNGQGRKGSKG